MRKKLRTNVPKIKINCCNDVHLIEALTDLIYHFTFVLYFTNKCCQQECII